MIAVAFVIFMHYAQAGSYKIPGTSSDDLVINPNSLLLTDSGTVLFEGFPRNSAASGFSSAIFKGGPSGLIQIVGTPLAPTQGQLVPKRGEMWFNVDGSVAVVATVQGQPSFFPRIFYGNGPLSSENEIRPAQWTSVPEGRLVVTPSGLVGYSGAVNDFTLFSDVLPCGHCYGELRESLDLFRFDLTNLFRVKLAIEALKEPIGTYTRRIVAVGTNLVVTFPPNTARSYQINDQGVVAYFSSQPSPIPKNGIYRVRNGATETIVESRADQNPREFSTLGRFAINSAGEVAFRATSRTLGNSWGIFRSADVVAGKIVGAGDLLNGVPFLGGDVVGSNWFNASGQIALLGPAGIWVTSGNLPTQEQESKVFRYTGPTEGSFGLSANWRAPDGEVSRVPTKDDTIADTALFDQPGNFTIDVGPSAAPQGLGALQATSTGYRHLDRLRIEAGQEILRAGSLLVDRLSFEEPSVLVSAATLILRDNIFLTNNHALIGSFGAARVELKGARNFTGSGSEPTARWVTRGSLRVGGPGEGSLDVDGGSIFSAETRIGGGIAGGEALVRGEAIWNTGNMAIGAGGSGSLEVKDYGFVASEQVVMGLEAEGSHLLSIDGKDSPPQGIASFAAQSLEIGRASGGFVLVKDGGDASIRGNTTLATRHSAFAQLLVAGRNANQAASFKTGRLIIGQAGTGEVAISEEGQVKVGEPGLANGDVLVGGSQWGEGELSVSGSGSILELLSTGGSVLIGSDNALGRMTITAGGKVLGKFGIVRCARSGSMCRAVIEGADSLWHLESTLGVGQNGDLGRGLIILLGGRIEATGVVVFSNGRIEGAGTIEVVDGLLVNEGYLSPAVTQVDRGAAQRALAVDPPVFTPGVLTIEGGYEQRVGGELVLQVGGTNSSARDQVVITGNAKLDGQVTLRFVNGFAPKAGDRIELLQVGGTREGEFTRVAVANLAPGFQHQVVGSGSSLSVTALNDAVFDPSLPGEVDVVVTNLGGLTYATVTVTTRNSCHSVALEGALKRSGNVFQQSFVGTRRSGDDCFEDIRSESSVQVLGALGPGEYSYEIGSGGQVLERVAFTVSENSGRSLVQPVRQANGMMRFEIQGLAPVPYRIEVCETLPHWTPLASGTLPATVTDPDAALVRTRFYRAVVGP